MDTTELAYLIPLFSIFLVMMIAMVIYFRKHSVDDRHIMPPMKQQKIPQWSTGKARGAPKAPRQTIRMPASQPKPPANTGAPSIAQTSAKKRATMNKIGKGLAALGAILLFLPLPEAFTTPSIGMMYVGYLIIKATSPKKKKKK